jgi:hypothetical protein
MDITPIIQITGVRAFVAISSGIDVEIGLTT